VRVHLVTPPGGPVRRVEVLADFLAQHLHGKKRGK
jgi:hypothetical protein